MSIEYLEQLLPLQLLPVQVKSTREGINLAKVITALGLYLDSNFECELTKWVLNLLGGSGEGVAAPFEETPLCIHLAHRLIAERALDSASHQLELKEGLAKLETGLLELGQHGYPWLASLPVGEPDAANWLASYYHATAGTNVDEYFGLYHYHFFSDQSHKLAENKQVEFSAFYRARVRPFLHLAKLDLDWKDLPPLVEVQNDPEKIALLLSRIKSRVALSSQNLSGKAMQDMLKLFELILQFVPEKKLNKEPDIPELAEVLSPDTEINQMTSAIEPALTLEIPPPLVAVAMNNAVLVPVESMQPGQYQMRREFDEASLKELAEDIKERGILEPLVVRRDPANLHSGSNSTYLIIAGERRYRAAKLAGLATVPVVIREMDEHEAEMAALAENLQRQDFTPLEEQQLFQALQAQYNWSISEIARRIHKSRHYIQKRLYGTLASFENNLDTPATEEETELTEANQAELPAHGDVATTTINQETSAEVVDKLLSPTANTTANTASAMRIPAMSSFVRFGRAVDRLISAVELLGLGDEAIRQEWLARLELVTDKLNQLKACLDD